LRYKGSSEGRGSAAVTSGVWVESQGVVNILLLEIYIVGQQQKGNRL